MKSQDNTVLGTSVWSDLPDDIWSLVLQKLPLEDFIRCQSVCSSWFSIIGDLKGCSSEPRFPWLMLPPEDREDPSRPYRFLDIASNKTHKICLPELDTYLVIHGSSNGWLILRDIRIPGDLRLFNPFTKVQIQLPTTPRYFLEAYLSVSVNEGYTAIIYYGNGNYRRPSFWYVKTGDEAWSGIDFGIAENRHGGWKGALYKGIFYVLDNQGHVRSFNLNHRGGDNNPRWLPLQVPSSVHPLYGLKEYLVVLPENEEPLLIQLSKTSEGDTVVKAFGLDQNEAEEIKKIDGHSLFLVEGNCAPSYNMMAITHAEGPIKENCVYIVYEETVPSLKVFDMEARCVTRNEIFGYKVKWGRGQPVWVTPVLVRL